MIKEISVLILAYLLGSIPSGLWIGKIFFHINLREHGSGNTGTTNTFRILGKKAGIIVFAIDFLKGTLAVLLPTFFGIQGISPMVFGLLAVLGHTFPVFAGFKGGKAVATSAGVLLGFSPATHFSCLFCSQPLFNQYDFVFEYYRCATRHFIGPPSSFDWMDLARL